MRPTPIAIDGPAASGKSTLGKALAERCGYLFLDTGAMYRAFALAAIEARIPASDAAACVALARTIDLQVEAGAETRVRVGGRDVTAALRRPEVERAVSAYSAIPGVRTELVRMQREAAMAGPAVVAGRDIGTVVLPDAPVKFYLDASDTARAERRSAQSSEWGGRQAPEHAREDIALRDRLDATRAASPLQAAADAIVIDTTHLSIDEVISLAMERIGCGGS